MKSITPIPGVHWAHQRVAWWLIITENAFKVYGCKYFFFQNPKPQNFIYELLIQCPLCDKLSWLQKCKPIAPPMTYQSRVKHSSVMTTRRGRGPNLSLVTPLVTTTFLSGLPVYWPATGDLFEPKVWASRDNVHGLGAVCLDLTV